MLQTIAIAAAIFVVVYLAGRYIKPLGGLYAFVFVLLGKPLARLEQFLDELRFKIDEDNTHPGLRTSVRCHPELCVKESLPKEGYSRE